VWAEYGKATDHFLCLKPENQADILALFKPFKLNDKLTDDVTWSGLSIGQHSFQVMLSGKDESAILEFAPVDYPGFQPFNAVLSYQIKGEGLAQKAAQAMLDRARESAVNPFSRCKGEIDAGAVVVEESTRRENLLDAFGLWILMAVAVGLLILKLALLRFEKRFAASVVLVGVSIAFVLCAVEIGLRASVDSWSMPIKLRDGCYHSNPRGYFKQASVKGQPDVTAYCTWGGEKAWADCDKQTAKINPDARRVLALGDSFTEAVGVFYEDTWPVQLQNMLNQKDAQQTSVINCGKAGLNVYEILDRYQKMEARHAPNVSVYAFVLNDAMVPHHVDGETMGEISFQWEDREAYETRIKSQQLVGRLTSNFALARLIAERLMVLTIADNTETMYRAMYREPLHGELVRELDLIESTARQAEAKGQNFLVAIWPLFYKLDNYPFVDAHRVLQRELKARKVSVIDLYPVFKDMAATQLQVHPTDYHPNEVAQKMAAKAIGDELKRLGWVSLR